MQLSIPDAGLDKSGSCAEVQSVLDKHRSGMPLTDAVKEAQARGNAPAKADADAIADDFALQVAVAPPRQTRTGTGSDNRFTYKSPFFWLVIIGTIAYQYVLAREQDIFIDELCRMRNGDL